MIKLNCGDSEGAELFKKLMQRDTATTRDELVQTYAVWSKTYEKDFTPKSDSEIKSSGARRGRAGAFTAELFTQTLKEYGYDKDAKILDLGCGTGLVGVQLHKHGYENIDGVDLSPDMLDVAKSKGIYRSLHVGYMGSEQCKELGVAANQYDAAISVGVYTLAHAISFDDLLHVVKPGGIVSFTVMRDASLDDPQCRFREKMDRLREAGKWKLITKHHEANYFTDGDGAWYFVYQIL